MGGEEDTGSEGAGVLAVDREEGEDKPGVWSVSYTHLTLPTICSV